MSSLPMDAANPRNQEGHTPSADSAAVSMILRSASPSGGGSSKQPMAAPMASQPRCSTSAAASASEFWRTSKKLSESWESAKSLSMANLLPLRSEEHTSELQSRQ